MKTTYQNNNNIDYVTQDLKNFLLKESQLLGLALMVELLEQFYKFYKERKHLRRVSVKDFYKFAGGKVKKQIIFQFLRSLSKQGFFNMSRDYIYWSNSTEIKFVLFKNNIEEDQLKLFV